MGKTVKISFEGKSAPALGLNTIIFIGPLVYVQILTPGIFSFERGRAKSIVLTSTLSLGGSIAGY